MNNFFENIKEFAPVLIVGFIAGILNADNRNFKHTHKLARFFYFVFGTFTSTFLCWICFEIAFYLTDKQNLSLAIGGFFAWRGANWVANITDKIINELIDKIDGKTDNR